MSIFSTILVIDDYSINSSLRNSGNNGVKIDRNLDAIIREM